MGADLVVVFNEQVLYSRITAGAGGELILALLLMAVLCEETEPYDVQVLIRGTEINLIIAGILSATFMGLQGCFRPKFSRPDKAWSFDG